MKSRMSRSRPERGRPRGALPLVLLLASAACASLPPLGGAEFNNHPAALVGEWIDSVKTTAGDTSLWVLGPSGQDGMRHRGPGGPGDVRHYGYWYLRGTLDTATDRALCFTNRPGRSAPSCRPFELDTVTTPAGPRRRLVVHGYQGAHSTQDRILLAYP